MPRLPTRCRTPGCPGTTTHRARTCPRCEHRTATAHRVTLACGPPCAGKNTYVSQHAQHGDLIVDLDALYAALNAQPHADDHDQPAALRPFAFDARDAVLNRLFDGDHIVRAAWIIASAPKREQREAFKARGIFIVMINTDEATCAARARTVRPEPWLSHIRDWFTSFTDGAIDATHP